MCVCECVCVVVCVCVCVCDPVWGGDGIEIMSKGPGGHGEVGLDRRGHIVIVLSKLAPQRGSREHDGVAVGSVFSGGQPALASRAIPPLAATGCGK